MAASNTFQVQSGRAVNIVAMGLYPGDVYTVQYAIDVGCRPPEANYVDYYENGKLVVLDETHNPLTLWRPGFYRVVPDAPMNENADVVISEAYNVNIHAAVDNVAEVS